MSEDLDRRIKRLQLSEQWWHDRYMAAAPNSSEEGRCERRLMRIMAVLDGRYRQRHAEWDSAIRERVMRDIANRYNPSEL